MKCKKCFKEIPENAVFCHLCGAKQSCDNMEDQVDAINDKLEITGFSFSEKGRIDCKQWIKEFGFDEVSESVDISLAQYLKFDQEEKPIRDSVNMVFDKIPGICANRKIARAKPYIADAQRMLGYANKKFYLSDYQKREYKEHIERVLYLLSVKSADYPKALEELCWKLKRFTDKWEFLDDIKEMIAGLEAE